MTKRDVNNIFCLWHFPENLFIYGGLGGDCLISAAFQHKQLPFILSIYCEERISFLFSSPTFYHFIFLLTALFISQKLLSCLMLLWIYGDIYIFFYMTVLSFGSEGQIRWGRLTVFLGSWICFSYIYFSSYHSIYL